MRSMRCYLTVIAVTGILASTLFAAIPLKGGEKILFIGNSLTNNGGGTMNFVKAALAAGSPSISVTVDQYIEFATELIDIYNHQNAVAKIRSTNWDIVVLQGWVHAEDWPPNTGARTQFIQAVKNFDSVIKQAGARTVLYMTFEGHFQNPADSVTRKIVLSYDSAQMAIGGCPVAPCGQAWQQIGKTPPPGKDSTWLFADLIHPNEIGQKLNGYCFYMTLTGKSPIGLPYSTAGLSGLSQTFTRSQDSLLQYWAWYCTSRWITSHAGTSFLRESVLHSPGVGMNMTVPRTGIMSAGQTMPCHAVRINGAWLSDLGNRAGLPAQAIYILPSYAGAQHR